MPAKKENLKDLKNVGKATFRDLNILGITSIDDLVHQDPTELFKRLERLTGTRHDVCMWDVFAAIIHEAKTGEPTSWWAWTAQRKNLQRAGKLTHLKTKSKIKILKSYADMQNRPQIFFRAVCSLIVELPQLV